MRDAVASINRETDLDSLREYFTDLARTQKQVAEDQRVTEAKDKMKEKLTQKEAA